MDPVDGGDWMTCIPGQLEGEAQKRARMGDFEKMLRNLVDEWVDGADGGRW
jgi:hypothetical protein